LISLHNLGTSPEFFGARTLGQISNRAIRELVEHMGALTPVLM
jgi:hypothetical protein